MTFLQSIAQYYLERNSSNNWNNLVFVFPSNRAGVFFRHALGEQLKGTDRTIFGINTTTINSLFAQQADLHIPDSLTLQLELWEVYQKLFEKDAPAFEFFYSWAPIFISDFSDIDSYMIDARQIFSNINDYEAYKDNYSYLTDQQRKAIKDFWGVALGNPTNDSASSLNVQHRFNDTYSHLYELYDTYRNRLKLKGLAYSGMAYRQVAESLDNCHFDETKHYIFVGLNALSTAEQKILQHLKDRGLATFFWDYPAEFLNPTDDKNSLGPALFLTKFTRDFPSPKDYTFPVSTTKPTVTATSFAYPQQQVYGVNDFLSNKQDGKTAIILADENMLLPVISSLQDNVVDRVNVTMGYPIKQSQLFGLVDLLARLHSHTNNTDFYYKDVLHILQHACVTDEEAQQIVKNIIRNNKIRIPAKELKQFDHIFRKVEAKDLPHYLRTIFEKIRNDFDEDQNAHLARGGNQLVAECAKEILKTINQFEKFLQNDVLQDQNTDLLFRIFISLLRTATVDFCGYPLEGLQIMGILETRAVDFDNIVILDCNEGILPKSSTTESFIPAVLRSAFGLPTYLFRDAMFAYYFFRLIYRATNVHLLYSSSGTDNTKGKSRYLLQLEYQYKDLVTYNERTATQQLNMIEEKPLTVEKTPEMLEILCKRFNGTYKDDEGNECPKMLSPSTLTSYLSCGLQFYFSKVVGLSDADDVTEDIDNRSFGNIFHRTMELLYKFIPSITAENKAILKKNVDKYLLQAFTKELKTPINDQQDLDGRNYLYYSVLKKYIEKTIEAEADGSEILKCEETYFTKITTASNYTIQFGGNIDRIYNDGKNLCVLDYKTGNVKKMKLPNIDSLFKNNGNDEYKEIRQTLLYCYFLSQNGETRDICPQILALSKLYDTSASRSVMKGDAPLSYKEVKDEFEEQLKQKIDEIFDVSKPFEARKRDTRNGPCSYCDFTSLCQKSTI